MVSLLSRILETYIDIEAPPQRIWEVLVDFPAWEEWNPFIPFVKGMLEVGNRLHIKVVPPGIRTMEFRPKVFVVRPFEEIVWGGSFLGIVYRGDHAILLEPLTAERTRFRQRERFRGPMVLFMSNMFEPTQTGYQQMNQALKQRVEDTEVSTQSSR